MRRITLLDYWAHTEITPTTKEKKIQMITWFRFPTLILISLLKYLSDQLPFGFGEMICEHQRDGLTIWSDLLEVSSDTKVDPAAQRIVSKCQAFSLSVKSACQQTCSTQLKEHAADTV